MDEESSDRRDFAHLEDTLVAGSSIGWTDEKHMLYVSLLEESFVNQLYDGKFSSKGPLCRPLRALSHIKSSKTDDTKIELDQFQVLRQGCWEMVEFDGARSRVARTKQIGLSSRCEDFQGRKVCCMDGDGSSTETVQEETSANARAMRSSHPSARHFRKHRYSPHSSTEASGQNFLDDETKRSGEASNRCNRKRRRPADDTLNDQVVPCAKAKFIEEDCNYAQEKFEDNCENSKVETGLPTARPAPSSQEDYIPKG